MSAFVPPLTYITHQFKSPSRSFTRGSTLLPSTWKRAQLQPFSDSCPHSIRSTPECFNEAPDGDEEFEEDEPQVTLLDPETRRSIAVGIEEGFEFEGQSYILCYPIDEAVALAKNSADGLLETVEDDNLVADLYPVAKAVCSEQRIELKNTAFVMTAEDDSEFDSLADEVEGDDDDDDDDEDEDDTSDDDFVATVEEESEQDVEVLAEFLHDGETYFVVRPSHSVWLVAKEQNGTYKAIRGEQLEQVTPEIERIISERDLSQ
ncbi:hypothetical protein BWQ96_05729 [Gracilariopsis chorda]|uniref:Uncharacterized protein n=1 Tax=Gracilariopsis chorda TaxID=448386 RepID=A0A2V3IQZ8_9FLOR|nr:hypothetical protein BWQ96_05729 [Gracilariopsis chorda]|eukprot:PXF44551.1 hypothetical protein BWQ96_05729 [Gracilariopsis chorda]